MPAMSRRVFLGKSAVNATVAATLSAAARGLRANPLGMPIGSQTYPHRQRIRDGDFAGLCKDMANLGVGALELCSPAREDYANVADGRKVRKILDDHGLKCPSAHITMDEFRTKLDQTIGWAKEVGMTQVGASTLGAPVQNGVTTMDAVKRAADEFNGIGAATARAGLQLFLHNEGFELSRVDGRLTYQVLMELLDPKLACLQFQMSAMRIVGDPVMYFDKYPGRFISMHLQGVNLDAPAAAPAAPAAGQAAPRGRGGPGLAVGKDSLDWAKIFAAAKRSGVKNYFVEQNWDLTVQSVAFLKTLNV